jgi:two-component system, cell cycle sensor histidine kinase and response regulator CckA
MPIFGLQPAGLLQTIFENIEIAVAVIDADERIVFANDPALQLFGSADGTPVGFQDWRQKFVFEDLAGNEIPIERSAVIRTLKGEHVDSQELRLKMPGGKIKWIQVWAYQFCAMGIKGVITLIADQTSDVELRKTVAQFHRMETLGALAAGLTHDFNNILNTISTNIAVASATESCSPELQMRFKHISEAVDTAAELVTRLMQFSRTQDIHRRTLQANDVVRDVLQLVQPLLRENISLVVDLAEALPTVYADSSQMQQVIINLIINALDAMPDGGALRVSTSAENHDQKTVSHTNNGKFICVSVADTGIGIPVELQSLIFEPFYTTKPAGQGTGLGLSSSYGIVQQHNGRIEVQSEPGRGTTFNVFIPTRAAFST